MKRITKIELENCRAYYSNYIINLPKGENLLIYGENGSGKSSLFKSFHDFFKSSIITQNFSKNLFNKDTDGKIELTFSEINTSDRENILSSNNYKFSDTVSNNNISFIKEASLLNGFLDYTDLLKIYLKSEPNPNLFDLVILNLLGEFIPVHTGVSTSIGAQYNFLIKNLITDAWTRQSKCHKHGLRLLPDFERNLRTTLDSMFVIVNEYLTNFFDLQDITIEYILQPINFNYPNNSRKSWFLNTDLRLKILKNGEELGNEYKEYLNEARLSSVAVCLYLSSLQLFPSQIEFKLIYLDDIFIGLDTANRIPIINILIKHFSDYQIIISTYDKNFFEVCNHKLCQDPDNKLWKSIEFYVGEYNISETKTIDVPIVLQNNNDLSKARFHLYNNERPDYPAAANYFRKYLEKKLLDVFPKEIFKDGNYEQIDSYKLSKIFNLCRNFIKDVDENLPELDEINSYLFILLHPLSHYNTSLHTYKKDLKEVDLIIKQLFENESKFDFLKNIKFCSFNTTVQIEFHINKYNIWHYEFFIKKPLFYNISTKTFSNCDLVCTKFYSLKNNVQQPAKTLNRGTSNIKYQSIEKSYEEITKIILKSYRFFNRPDCLFDKVRIFNGVEWENLDFKIRKKFRK
ncbi:ATP-binding protein [Chryseobacterium bernardetii]|uniref:ATP-binding protein n=1 Tax=Chryseobacterium bernardetii TaxID=1241978 RepID=UPI00162875B1|nr:ATP-binding protein [Chryseobacterium bernardetii]